MRGLAVVWAVAAASCYSPSPHPGGACADGQCPAPLECDPATDTCVDPGGSPDASRGPDACAGVAERCDGIDNNCDGSADEGFGVGDGCTVGVGACATAGTQVCNSAQTGVDCMAIAGGPDAEICGDGIDQDCDTIDPPCPANDLPAGAIDISAGGTFTGELAAAHDDAQGCGAPGGRDLFYEITVPGTQVVYIDSFGSDFDVVIHAYDGDCANVADPIVCLDDECGAQAQGAGELSGTACIVVDQGQGAGETHGHVQLHVIRGRRPGTELVAATGTITGTTVGASNLAVPICEGDSDQAPDLGYFFTVCEGATVTVTADTCQNTPYDSWLSIRQGDGRTGPELECLDDLCGPDGDDSRVSHTITGPGLYWILVDGFANESGAFSLDYSIQ